MELVVFFLILITIILFSIKFFVQKKIVALFLFILFVFNVIHYDAGLSIKSGIQNINFQKILILIIFSAVLYFNKYLIKPKYDHKMLFAIIGLVFFRFVSIFYSSSFFSSFSFWFVSIFTWYSFYFLILKLIHNETQLNGVVKILFYTGVFAAFFNYFEFFTGINFAHLLPNVSNSLIFWQYERFGFTRVFGIFADPVATSYYLILTIPLGWYLYNQKKSFNTFFLVLFMSVGLLLNFSRASVFALFIMFVLYLLFVVRHRVLSISIIVVFSIGIIITDNSISRTLYSMVNETKKGNISSFDETRFENTSTVFVKLFEQTPLFGIGTGSLYKKDLLENYFEKFGYLYAKESIRTELPFFITVTIDSGIFAAVCLVFLFVYAIVKSYKISSSYKTRQTMLSSYLLLVFIGYTICLISNGVFYSIHMFFIYIGLLNVIMNLSKAKNDNLSSNLHTQKL